MFPGLCQVSGIRPHPSRHLLHRGKRPALLSRRKDDIHSGVSCDHICLVLYGDRRRWFSGADPGLRVSGNGEVCGFLWDRELCDVWFGDGGSGGARRIWILLPDLRCGAPEWAVLLHFNGMEISF